MSLQTINLKCIFTIESQFSLINNIYIYFKESEIYIYGIIGKGIRKVKKEETREDYTINYSSSMVVILSSSNTTLYKVQRKPSDKVQSNLKKMLSKMLKFIIFIIICKCTAYRDLL